MTTHSDNLKVECAENCGNSPKKKILKDLSIAFAKKEVGFCLDWMTDDVVWDIVGNKLIQGKDDFQKAFNQIKNREVEQLRIHNIITHGNTGSVNGILILNNEERVAFCNVYNFAGFGKNAKIKVISSYVIQNL